MKTFACVILLAAVVAAEPPRYRQIRFGRQELGETPQIEEGEQRSEDAPYPAAGFRPNKEFKLPSREETAPASTTYGVPDDSYGAPLKTYLSPEYGLPEGETRQSKEGDEEAIQEKSEIEEKKENLAVEKKENLEQEPKKEAEILSNQGAYYVLLPGSQLQRVQFQTENDLRNMAYTARLQYSTEERAPLFLYTAVPQYQPSAAYVQLY